MSDGQRPLRDLAVNVFSGAGLGLLLGVVLGLSKSPVVAIVVGSLTSLLAVFLGLDGGGEANPGILSKVRLNGVRIGSFGFATVLGVLLGLHIRINSPLTEPPEQLLARWKVALPDNLVLARQLMIFERTGLTPATLSFGEGPAAPVTVGEGAATKSAVLFSGLRDANLCTDLNPAQFKGDEAILEAYDDQKIESLKVVADKIRRLPEGQRHGALVGAHTMLCEFQKESKK